MHDDKHDDYLELTKALHFKIGETENLTVEVLISYLVKSVKIDTGEALSYDKNKKLVDFIYEYAEECIKNPDQGINLENKIVLSIAIRLKTEQFLIGKIADDTWVKTLDGFQTRNLIKKYKTIYTIDEVNKTLDEVNIMTPENIHINAFMYEPIMDMSDHHLIKLYKKVEALK